MSNITAEHLMATMREVYEKYPPPPPSPFADLFRPTYCGERLIEAPPPVPKIQCQDIKFDDGTSILSSEFRARMNAWLIERFGYHDDFFADKVLMISGLGMVVSRRNIGLITNLGV